MVSPSDNGSWGRGVAVVPPRAWLDYLHRRLVAHPVAVDQVLAVVPLRRLESQDPLNCRHPQLASSLPPTSTAIFRYYCLAPLSSGRYHTCEVTADGLVECWGHDQSGQATPPSGEFASVSTGFLHTCGVRRDRSVECWGSNKDIHGREVGGTIFEMWLGALWTCRHLWSSIPPSARERVALTYLCLYLRPRVHGTTGSVPTNVPSVHPVSREACRMRLFESLVQLHDNYAERRRNQTPMTVIIIA